MRQHLCIRKLPQYPVVEHCSAVLTHCERRLIVSVLCCRSQAAGVARMQGSKGQGTGRQLTCRRHKSCCMLSLTLIAA